MEKSRKQQEEEDQKRKKQEDEQKHELEKQKALHQQLNTSQPTSTTPKPDNPIKDVLDEIGDIVGSVCVTM